MRIAGVNVLLLVPHALLGLENRNRRVCEESAGEVKRLYLMQRQGGGEEHGLFRSCRSSSARELNGGRLGEETGHWRVQRVERSMASSKLAAAA